MIQNIDKLMQLKNFTSIVSVPPELYQEFVKESPHDQVKFGKIYQRKNKVKFF